MYHKIKSVKALENMKLSVVFQDGTEKEYNIRTRYSVFPQFVVFETNPELFVVVKVDIGGCGIFWNGELDLSADEIWENGIMVEKTELSELEKEKIMRATHKIGDRYYRINGRTIAKHSGSNGLFYVLEDDGEWRVSGWAMNKFYDAASDCVEIILSR